MLLALVSLPIRDDDTDSVSVGSIALTLPPGRLMACSALQRDPESVRPLRITGAVNVQN
jgi:hypothetical protein